MGGIKRTKNGSLFLKALEELEQERAEDLKSEVPKKWERHGDMIILPANAFCSDVWASLFPEQNVWDLILQEYNCKRIARKTIISNDDFRTPKIEVIFGSDCWVTHIDNGISYSFDVTKCMFSAGNITEKLRIASFDCTEETVVDLYAGIGYFTLPFLVHAKAKHVHACEWNVAAVEALECNLVANNVLHKCTIHIGDNIEVCPVGIADRVNLGLIPTSRTGWETACRALNPDTGGILHIHENVSSNLQKSPTECLSDKKMICASDSGNNLFCNVANEITNTKDQKVNRRWQKKKKCKAEWTLWSISVTQEIKGLLDSLAPDVRWTVEAQNIEHVKSYAPRIDHLVLDLLCRPVK